MKLPKDNRWNLAPYPYSWGTNARGRIRKRILFGMRKAVREGIREISLETDWSIHEVFKLVYGGNHAAFSSIRKPRNRVLRTLLRLYLRGMVKAGAFLPIERKWVDVLIASSRL